MALAHHANSLQATANGTRAKLPSDTTDTRMRNLFRYGNKAALIVGVLLLFLDNIPLAHEFGAWPIGCMLCFWYSATAVWEDQRIGPKVKYALIAYLVIALLILLFYPGFGEDQGEKPDWSLPPALKSMGVGK